MNNCQNNEHNIYDKKYNCYNEKSVHFVLTLITWNTKIGTVFKENSGVNESNFKANCKKIFINIYSSQTGLLI